MEVTVSSPESYKKVLDINAPFEEFKDIIDSAYEKYRKQVNMPGFRKGKAPMSLIKSRYKGAIESEVIPDIITSLYQKGVTDEKIIPINQPKIDKLQYDEGEKISFSAEVEIRPEITLKDYKGIKVKKNKVDFKKADLDNYLKYIQESRAVSSKVDRAAAKEDVIIAEFQELDPSGMPLVGQKTEKRQYHIGAGMFSDDFDDALVGIKAGEERKITTVVSKDYPNKKIAGQEVSFNVKVDEVQERTLPELNDEFAKELGFDDVEKMKADTEKRMIDSMENQEKDRIRREIITEIIKKNEFDIPPSMVDNYLHYMLEERKRMNPQIDEKGFMESSRQHAVQQIKEHMVIDQVGKQENIEVTDDDIKTYIDKAASDNPENKKRLEDYVKDARNRERLENDLIVSKVLDFLEAEAAVK